MKVFRNPPRSQWPQLLERPAFDSAALETRVAAIIEDVRQNGDQALRALTLKFDGVAVNELAVRPEDINAALSSLDPQLKGAMELAASNIRKFHEAQLIKEPVIQTMAGVTCWRKSVAIERVGLYIPGGTAPLFSTLLMLAIPASLAGCREVIVCTPPGKDGNVDPAVLAAAALTGINTVYKVGGVQAIAAMGIGTETIAKVYKIFGPGNQYVTTAKQLIQKEGVAIDMPAGPSEVAIYADQTADPAFVAADLLSQAEHGADSQVLLVSDSEEIIEKVANEVDLQLAMLPRKIFAAEALGKSRTILVDSAKTAMSLLNDYAPEHLILASDNAAELAEQVVNAGSVFLGHFTPESAGDYASGTNHTLPTNGYAHAYSGVSVDSFVKKITFQQITPAGLAELGPSVQIMAEAEGLQAHARAVSIRLDKL